MNRLQFTDGQVRVALGESTDHATLLARRPLLGSGMPHETKKRIGPCITPPPYRHKHFAPTSLGG